jgi:hypothetical protein
MREIQAIGSQAKYTSSEVKKPCNIATQYRCCLWTTRLKMSAAHLSKAGAVFVPGSSADKQADKTSYAGDV